MRAGNKENFKMSIKILINAVDSEECRIAKISSNKLEEFHIETAAREITQGNIYKGIVTRVEPSLQAVFVDYGSDRHGFLQRQEIHTDYFQDGIQVSQSLRKLIKKGQEVMVQVTKDPAQTKGAMLTTFISLPGRYAVLMPGSTNIGVSRKIENEEERKRLKEIISKLKLPEDFGLILRTIGENCTKTDVDKDVRYLMKLWKEINVKAQNEKAPALLYKERSLALRSIRDYLTPDVKEIIIDHEAVYKEVKQFVQIISAVQAKQIKHHKGDNPLFAHYKIEDQISSIFEKRVQLKSGGYIIIEQTEALVSIDVNSGKATQQDSIEQTAFSTNQEAAEEIARQLRLRDLGGLIIIDFIDMKETKHKLEIEKNLKAHLKEDKARAKIGKISKFGLLELSRQRIRPSIEFGSFITCPLCSGKGTILSTEALGLAFLRELRTESLKQGITQIKASLPVNVANYILNNKRSELYDIETKKGITITILGEHGIAPMAREITSS